MTEGMLEEFLKIGSYGIEKKKFHSSKKAIDLNNLDMEKILVSNKFNLISLISLNLILSVTETKKHAKYFIGYKTHKKIRPLFFTLLQMSGYRNKFEKAYCLSFVIKDEKL